MALPSKVNFVTFDVYGTLIDWEAGISEAFEREAARDGFTIDDPDEILPRFHEYQREIQSGSYELYAEVLRRAAMHIAKEIGWPLEPSRVGFLPDSVQRWMPFKETNPQLKKFGRSTRLGLISNIDDKLLGQTRRHIPTDFDLVVTAQQVRSYKPDPAHFKEFARRIGGKKGWVHVASSYYHDVEPCLKEKVPVIWVNRTQGELEPGQQKPTAEVKTLLEAMKLLGAARRARLMQVVAPARGRRRRAGRMMWQIDVHARAPRARRTFVVDSPVFPDELDALPGAPGAGRLVAVGPAGHPRRLGPPPGALRVPRRGAGRAPRRPPRACAAEPGDAQRASCASSTRRTTSSARGRCRSGRSRRCRCRASSRSASDELELHPGRRPHARRHGDLGAVGARAARRRLPARRSRSRGCRSSGSRSAYLATLGG